MITLHFNNKKYKFTNRDRMIEYMESLGFESVCMNFSKFEKNNTNTELYVDVNPFIREIFYINVPIFETSQEELDGRYDDLCQAI